MSVSNDVKSKERQPANPNKSSSILGGFFFGNNAGDKENFSDGDNEES